MTLFTPRLYLRIDEATWIAGVATLARYAAGDRVATYREHMGAVVVLQAQTDYLTARWHLGRIIGSGELDDSPGAAWAQLCVGGECILGDQRQEAEYAGLAPLYAATGSAIRGLVHGATRLEDGSGGLVLPPGGDELGAIPAIAVYGLVLVGASAIAGATWWVTERDERRAEVDKHAASTAAQLAQYQAWLDDQYRRGEPAPKPPPFIDAAALEAGVSPWIAGGVGVVLGAVAVVGVAQSRKPARRATARRLPNPRRRRRLRTRRRNPSVRIVRSASKATTTTTTTTAPKKRAAPKKAAPKKAAPKKAAPKKAAPKKAAPKKAAPKKRAAPKKAAPKKAAKKKARAAA
jgi:hypothetical protein